MNIGELVGTGVVLRTREVIALVYEVCRQADMSRAGGFAFPRAADDLWLTEAGDVSIVQPDGSVATTDPRSAVATLLDALLPPPSERPEYAVPSPLRTLPARLHASAESAAIADPKDLLAILRRYLNDDPRQLLQQLVIRAAVPPRGEPVHLPVETPSSHPPLTGPAVVPLGSCRDTLDLFTPESAPRAAAHSAPAPSHDPDVFRTEPTSPVITQRGRRRTSGAVRGVAALALIVTSGYAGYTYVRLAESSRGRNQAQLEPGVSDRPGQAPHGPALGETIDRSETPPEPAGAPGSAAPAVTLDARKQPYGAIPPTADHDRAGADTSHPLMLPVPDGAFSPSFASTGRALLFHSGRERTGRLLEADLDDRGLPSRISPVLATSVRDNAAKDYHARLSPDGRLVAFDSDRDGERGVYVSDRDGSQSRRVSGSGFAAVPSWSPDMKWLAFVRAEPTRPRVWNLWLRDLASGTLTRQTSFRVGQVWGASWFPDGRRLCYSHEDQLIITDIATRTSDTFRTPRPGRLIRTPAVSPDGRRIVFQVFRDGVWLLDLQTRSMRRILDDVTAEEFAWDPQGQRFAYHSRRDGTWRIWMTTPPPI